MEDIEIILVDDGSRDGCPRLCDGYACRDARITVVYQKNAGLGLARNAGLNPAKGEYVVFVDADDYIPTEAYATLYEKAKEENADVVHAETGRQRRNFLPIVRIRFQISFIGLNQTSFLSCLMHHSS